MDRIRALLHWRAQLGEPRMLVQRLDELAVLHPVIVEQPEIDRVLDQAGLSPDARKFAPHVSIGRVRGPLSSARLGSYLMRHSLYRSEVFPVSSFHLYSSWSRPEGAEYQVEASYELLPGLGDAWQQHRMRLALRLLAHARNLAEIGPEIEALELDDLARLLGRRPASVREGQRELNELVKRAGADLDAELTRYFHRHASREEALMRGAMGRAEGARATPLG